MKDYLKPFLFNNKVSYLFLSLVILLFLIVIGVFLLKNRKLQKELNQIKLENEDAAAANGLVIYKDFAYYNPAVGPSELYCKPCREDSKKVRRLSGDGPFYDCSRCGKRAIDHEMQKRMQEESDKIAQARGFFS